VNMNIMFKYASIPRVPRQSAMKAAALPKNYELIYDIVRQHGVGTHLTTGEIYVQAKLRRPAIGYSTVYRALLRLRDAGRISEIIAHGQAAVYEPVGPRHAHFFCTDCRKLSDLDFQLSDDVVRKLAAVEGATISGASLTIQGMCSGCSSASE